MTKVTTNNILKAAVTVTALACTQFSQAAPPLSQYACHVRTADGQSGLVLVTTNTAEHAIKLSSTASAIRMDGSEGRALGVVECVKAMEGVAFKDARFNSFYVKFPR